MHQIFSEVVTTFPKSLGVLIRMEKRASDVNMPLASTTMINDDGTLLVSVPGDTDINVNDVDESNDVHLRTKRQRQRCNS